MSNEQKDDPTKAVVERDARIDAQPEVVPEAEVAKGPEDRRAAKKAAKQAAKRAAKEARLAKAAANAELEKALPALTTVLKDIGYTEEQRANWLSYVRSRQLTESDVLSVVAPPDRGAVETWRGRLAIARHGLKRWYRSQNPILRLLYVSGWLYLLIASATKLAWSPAAILSVILVVGAKMKFVVRDMRPKNMQLVDRGYNERKVLLQTLIETQQRWFESPPSQEQTDQFRREALTLIANYVRDHRARFGSREILANVLVRDGGHVVVVGRSDGIRPVPKKYTAEECALVWRAIASGEPQITGDLYADFPGTVPGKKYRSIIVLPVWFKGAVVGAVSIDSQDKYHFHLDYDDLQVHLSPYVQLLAYTLVPAQSATLPASGT